MGLQAWRVALLHRRRKQLQSGLSMLRLNAARHQAVAEARLSAALVAWRAVARDEHADRWERCERWLDEIEVATASLFAYSRRDGPFAVDAAASAPSSAQSQTPRLASADDPGSWADARLARALSRWRARALSYSARQLRMMRAARWRDAREAARAWGAWAELRLSRPLGRWPPIWRRHSLTRALGRRDARRALIAFREHAAHAAARRAAERARFAALYRAAAHRLATWQMRAARGRFDAARVVRALRTAWRGWRAAHRPPARVRPLAILRAEIAAEIAAGMRSSIEAERRVRRRGDAPRPQTNMGPVERAGGSGVLMAAAISAR